MLESSHQPLPDESKVDRVSAEPDRAPQESSGDSRRVSEEERKARVTRKEMLQSLGVPAVNALAVARKINDEHLSELIDLAFTPDNGVPERVLNLYLKHHSECCLSIPDFAAALKLLAQTCARARVAGLSPETVEKWDELQKFTTNGHSQEEKSPAPAPASPEIETFDRIRKFIDSSGEALPVEADVIAATLLYAYRFGGALHTENNSIPIEMVRKNIRRRVNGISNTEIDKALRFLKNQGAVKKVAEMSGVRHNLTEIPNENVRNAVAEVLKLMQPQN